MQRTPLLSPELFNDLPAVDGEYVSLMYVIGTDYLNAAYEPGRVLETVLAEDLFLFFTLFERNSETVHQLTLWVLAYYANQSTLISAASK